MPTHGVPEALQGVVAEGAGKVAADCSPTTDPNCHQDWTNTGAVYGPYWAAKFFGLIP